MRALSKTITHDTLPPLDFLIFTMTVTTKELPKSRMELTITVSVAEQQPHLIAAAQKISSGIKTPGFRPGLAPYDIVVSQVGEMKILDTALEALVRQTYVQAIKDSGLKAVGMPEITFDKVVPKNVVVYRAVVSLIPAVTIPDLSKISIEVKPEPVTDEKIDGVLKELAGMHALVAPTDTGVGPHDQVTVDMDLLDGAVPLEGGLTRGHVVHMDEEYYVPGFTDKLLGAKIGDALSFELLFPKDHYQKIYAGKDITFKVKISKVERRELPEINEDFAKKLGVASVAELRENITKNIADEQKRKAEEVAEIEMLKTIASKTIFGDLPENLIESERRKMFQELMHNLQQHGITPEQYLSDMKKSPEEIEAGFTDQAIERTKLGLITFEIAQTQNLDVNRKELEVELDAIRASYKNNSDAIKRLNTAEVQEMVMNSLRNRKVMEWLNEKIIKSV